MSNESYSLNKNLFNSLNIINICIIFYILYLFFYINICNLFTKIFLVLLKFSYNYLHTLILYKDKNVEYDKEMLHYRK